MQSEMRKYFGEFLPVFFTICILLLPFPFHLWPGLGLADALSSVNPFAIGLQNREVSSDSAGMVRLLPLLLIIALIFYALLQFSFHSFRGRIFEFLKMGSLFFLVLILFRYGFDKILKTQFYYPEPNILATELGRLDRDILFWSTMGLSPEYNYITGTMEIFAALLIFLRRTRVLGLIFSAFILMQVILINFSFDISVKLFSIFLFLLNIYLLSPWISRLWNFLILNKIEKLQKPEPLIQPAFVSNSLVIFLLGLCLLEGLLPSLRSGVWNDDKAPRPMLHGAYRVLSYQLAGKELSRDSWPLKRAFFHRRNYLILENLAGDKEDWMMKTDSIQKIIYLEDLQNNKMKMKYELNQGTLVLNFNSKKGICRLRAEKI